MGLINYVKRVLHRRSYRKQFEDPQSLDGIMKRCEKYIHTEIKIAATPRKNPERSGYSSRNITEAFNRSISRIPDISYDEEDTEIILDMAMRYAQANAIPFVKEVRTHGYVSRHYIQILPVIDPLIDYLEKAKQSISREAYRNFLRAAKHEVKFSVLDKILKKYAAQQTGNRTLKFLDDVAGIPSRLRDKVTDSRAFDYAIMGGCAVLCILFDDIRLNEKGRLSIGGANSDGKKYSSGRTSIYTPKESLHKLDDPVSKFLFGKSDPLGKKVELDRRV